MIKIYLFIFFFLTKTIISTAQNIQIVSFNTLEKIIKKKNDTTYVVNFFASWCAPCMKELPEVLAFAKAQENEKIKVILVSLDFKKEYEKSLLSIIEKYHIPQAIFLLDEPNPNKWIDKIDENWSGAIPATLFINHAKKKKKLVTQSLNLGELNALLR